MAEEAEIPEVAKGSSRWVQNIFTLIMALGIAFNMYNDYYIKTHPEEVAQEADKDYIDTKFKLTEEKLLHYGDSIAKKSFWQHKKIDKRLDNLEVENKSQAELIEGINNQAVFNTHNIGTLSQATYELMKDDAECKDVRYTRNRIDRYLIWEEDYYTYPTLQRITAGSGCQATIHPQGRNFIKLKLNKR